jgi:bis(5'-nucleosidyl)-tetraphosphatase
LWTRWPAWRAVSPPARAGAAKRRRTALPRQRRTTTTKTKVERSAGGVIYREHGGDIRVCLVATNGGKTWQLPKGIIERGERGEDAARREVEEETGLRGDTVGPISDVEYWYVSPWEGEPVRIHKFVKFFLLRHTGGSTRDHDGEVDTARWFKLGEARRKLSYAGEREVLEQAARALEDTYVRR